VGSPPELEKLVRASQLDEATLADSKVPIADSLLSENTPSANTLWAALDLEDSAPAAERKSDSDTALELPSIESDPPPRGSGREWGKLDSVDSPTPAEAAPRISAPVPQPIAPTASAFGALELEAPAAKVAAPAAQNTQTPSQIALDVTAPEIKAPSQTDVQRTPNAAEKPTSRLRLWIALAAVTVVFLGSGALLGLTRHGFFGTYFIERFLPEAGEQASTAALIQRLEPIAATDSYQDVRKLLAELGKARQTLGLDRDLLSRSLLQESLFIVRFGPNAQSESRAASIEERLRKRGFEASGIELSRGAYALSRHNLTEAQGLIAQAQAQAPKDGYTALVAAELALAQNNSKAAIKQFSQASKSALTGARALWGLARARTMSGDDEQASEFAVDATLAHTPSHASALTAKAQFERQRGEVDSALTHAQQATGTTPVGKAHARGSDEERAAAWTLVAQLYEQQRAWGKAQSAYDAALAADPHRGWALVGAGRALLREQRYKEALARFEAVISRKLLAEEQHSQKIVGPMYAAKLGAANALLALGQKQQAAAILSTLAQEAKDDWQIQVTLGRVLYALGQTEQAEAKIRAAIKIAPTEFDGYLALAELMYQLKRPDDVRKAIALAESKVEMSADVYRERARFELEHNQLDTAEKFYRLAKDKHASDPGVLFGLGTTLRRKERFADARVVFEELSKVDANYPGLALEQGLIYEGLGDAAGAADLFRRALAERPKDHQLRLRYGAALFIAGQLDDAQKEIDAVRQGSPNSADVAYYLGRIALKRGDTIKASEELGRAVAIEPTRAEFHAYFAWALLEKGLLGRASAEADACLTLDQRLAEAHWVRGKIQLRAGTIADALISLKKALTLKPELHAVYGDLGDALEQSRKVPEAIAAYRKGLDYDPLRGDWWYRLARVLLDAGKTAEARSALNRALAQKPKENGDKPPLWFAETHRLLGDVSVPTDVNSAIDHYRTYLQLAPASASDREAVTQTIAKLTSSK